jgi:hypothetical protein
MPVTPAEPVKERGRAFFLAPDQWRKNPLGEQSLAQRCCHPFLSLNNRFQQSFAGVRVIKNVYFGDEIIGQVVKLLAG